MSSCGSLNIANIYTHDQYLKRWQFDTSQADVPLDSFDEWLLTREVTWVMHIAQTPRMLFVDNQAVFIATTSGVTPMTSMTE